MNKHTPLPEGKHLGSHENFIRPNIPNGAALVFAIGLLWAPLAATQGTPDIFRIKDNVFRSRVEYHEVKIPKGGDLTLIFTDHDEINTL